MPKTWAGATASPSGFSVVQAIQAFDGKRAELVAAFAEVDAGQKGYYKDTAYKSASRNFERWNAAQTQIVGPLPEGEKRKQARAISPANQAKLDAIVQARLRRDRPLPHLSIKGKIGVNGSDQQRRPRRIEKPITWANVDRIGAVARRDGDRAAWYAFSEWYGEGIDMYPAGAVDIKIS